jgi:hypothetical protein
MWNGEHPWKYYLLPFVLDVTFLSCLLKRVYLFINDLLFVSVWPLYVIVWFIKRDTNILLLISNTKLYWSHFEIAMINILSFLWLALNGLLIASHIWGFVNNGLIHQWSNMRHFIYFNNSFTYIRKFKLLY